MYRGDEETREFLRPVVRQYRDDRRARGRRGSILMVWFAIIAGCLMFWSCVAALAVKAFDGKAMTKEFEGFRPEIYQCSAGARTIGYGFNLSDPFVRRLIPDSVASGQRPLTRDEADRIFDEVYSLAERDARAFVGDTTFDALSPVRQAVLTDMAYNLGRTRLSKFRKLRAAIREGDYIQAAGEMKHSLWYRQTGRRARQNVVVFARPESV